MERSPSKKKFNFIAQHVTFFSPHFKLCCESRSPCLFNMKLSIMYIEKTFTIKEISLI